MPEFAAVPIPEFEAIDIARIVYGRSVTATRLPGEWDDNFRLTDSNGTVQILKIAHPSEVRDALDLQTAAIQHIAREAPGVAIPRVQPALDGTLLPVITTTTGITRYVRLLQYVPGDIMAGFAPYSAKIVRSVGTLMAVLDRALLTFEHPAAVRFHAWDARNSGAARDGLDALTDPRRHAMAERRLAYFEQTVRPQLDQVRNSVIHGDPNDYNIVIGQDIVTGAPRATGIIDFGDVVRTALVSEVATAAAYAVLNSATSLAGDPLADAALLVAGYDEHLPLTDEEFALVYPLLCTRLTVSVITSARRQLLEPDNTYIAVSQAPAWAVLEKLEHVSHAHAEQVLRRACGRPLRVSCSGNASQQAAASSDMDMLLAKRRQYLSPNVGLSYRSPLHIVRGRGQYLYAADGREYLDAYNNVAHVGHSHPYVIDAIARQAALLNTNTRYLHELILEYAARLTAQLPAPLEVCYFVNSASEANELALRIAHTATGRRSVLVTDGAYHGNTRQLIDVSPYKHNGPGGEGAPPDVRTVPVPDVYRGAHCGPDAGVRYAEYVRAAVEAVPPSAFLIESLLSCGGQIVLPDSYLAQAFSAVRAAGGVCIVDEVQVGFGRVGSRMWGFELQNVVPDIVVMGKPMGNGHPLAAVVTTHALADAFSNGMEYFNTYGGNPVSMAAGLAVLDVLETEGLQAHAQVVGDRLLQGLTALRGTHPIIGDVRGRGLFVGIELVRDRDTKTPAGEEASAVVNALKDHGILAGTDGPYHNVIKLKPPMVFDAGNADRVIETLDIVLRTFN